MSSLAEHSQNRALVLLGLDIGGKRTGLALAHGAIATEHGTLTNPDRLPDDVARICREESVDLIVIGLPLNTDHTESDQSSWVRDQAEMIATATALPVQLEDEYLTSWEAERQLKALGLPTDAVKERLDARSAKILLEQYLANEL